MIVLNKSLLTTLGQLLIPFHKANKKLVHYYSIVGFKTIKSCKKKTKIHKRKIKLLHEIRV